MFSLKDIRPKQYMLGQVYLGDTVLRLLCGFLEVTFYSIAFSVWNNLT